TIARVLEPGSVGLGVSYPLQLPAQDEWYLPITLQFRQSPADREVAFALVPVRRLVASTDSLRLIPDSFVSMVAVDGRRLFTYAPGVGSFKALRGHVSPQSLEQVGDRRNGVFLSLPSKSGFVGFARSSALPLYVSASVPIASLHQQWLGQAAAPAAVLAMGVLAVLVFAWQLHRALRRQAAYVAEQEYLAQHDTLTGLKNREGFMRELERTIANPPGEPRRRRLRHQGTRAAVVDGGPLGVPRLHVQRQPADRVRRPDRVQLDREGHPHGRRVLRRASVGRAGRD